MASLLAATLGLGPQEVFAAEANQVTIDSVTFVAEDGSTVHEVDDYSYQWLEVKLSVPANATTPVAGRITLPRTLIGQEDRFDIFAPDTTRNGECSVFTRRVECELDDSYVLKHPDELSGAVRFQVRVALKNTAEVTTTFPVGGIDSNEVTVKPEPEKQMCTSECSWVGSRMDKYGRYNNRTESINWTVRVHGEGTEGLIPVGMRVVIVDEIDFSIYSVDKNSPRLYSTDRTVTDKYGKEQLGTKTEFESDEFSVSADKTRITFITAAGAKGDPTLRPNERGLEGRAYYATWDLIPLDGGSAVHYKNTVRVEYGGPGSGTGPGSGEGGGAPKIDRAEAEVERKGGSGEALGTSNGRLAITKAVTAEGVDKSTLPSSYRVEWTACDTAAKDYDPQTHTSSLCKDGQVSLRPDQTFYLNPMSQGTRVVMHEVTQTEPAHVRWDQSFQVVDEDNVPVPGVKSEPVVDVTFSAEQGNLATTTYYLVNNRAQLAESHFVAKKTVKNPDGVDLGQIEGYPVEYSYPASTELGFPKGSGTLTLPATGASVSSDPVPLGAVVTLTEEPPTRVPGASWGKPTFVPGNQFVVTAESPQTEIVVENSITRLESGFEITKKANPASGSEVFPGDTITYTVTGENTGASTLDRVVIEDDLSGLVDQVTLNEEIFATINGEDPAGKHAVNSEGDLLSWNGSIDPGKTVTITYSVTVSDTAGGHTLENRVNGTGQALGQSEIRPPAASTSHRVHQKSTPETTPPVPETTPPVPETQPPGSGIGSLPSTGAENTGTLGAMALLLLALGATVFIVRRRTQHHDAQL